MQAQSSTFLRHSVRLASSVRTTLCRTSYRQLSWTSPSQSTDPNPTSSRTDSTLPTPTETSNGKQKAEAPSAEATPSIAEEKDKIPLLSRPLGVKEPPTTKASTWTQNMMNEDVRQEQREKLVKAVGKGYFSDLNATRRHGGKTWIAPRVLIREDKARYFPDVKGTPLSGGDKVHTTSLCLGKVSIISILSSKMSEVQSTMFTEPTHATFSSNPLYQHIQINLQENIVKSFLVSLFASSIRKHIPEEQWDKYLISSQNMDYVREDLGMNNRHVGYVYLVDHACRVRWAACADPKPEEIEALKACTSVLLKRKQV